MISCPEEIRAKNRKKKNRKTWRSKNWIEAKARFLWGTLCIWCGRYAQVPHHPTDEYYGKDEYVNLHLSGCIPMCNRCHRGIHRGLVICPVCKDHLMAPHKDACRYCDPGPALAWEARKVQIRKRQREYRQQRYQELKAAREAVEA